MTSTLPFLGTRTVAVPVDFFGSLRKTVESDASPLTVDVVRDAGYHAGQALFDTFSAWLSERGEEAPDSLDDERFSAMSAEFFEEYADLLGSIYIAHPHGGRAIPLAERQMLTLREKSKVLEGKLRELVQFGEENDSISERLHRITLALLKARDIGALLDALYAALQRDFAISAVTVRAWPNALDLQRNEFAEVSPVAHVFAESLAEPYFCAQPMFESASWLPAAEQNIGSLAYLPLRAESTFGLLVLASEDDDRFAPDKGTLYLARLSEAVSMALRRYCEV